MLPFPKFENAANSDQSIMKNSAEIQQKKMVKQIHPISDHEWIATIQSQTLPDQTYQVLVRIKDGFVSYMTCNCPYDCGSLCKHIGATLLEIRKKKLHTKPKQKQLVDLENPDGIKVSFVESDFDAPPQRIQKEIVRMTQYATNKENEDINLLDAELECNVCLSCVENPVLLPCQAHAMCYDCFSRLYARKTVQKGGYRYVVCPVCTDNGGKLTLRNLESIKVCKKLERIVKAHETEKNKTTVKFDKLTRDQEKEKEIFDDFIKCYAGKSEEWMQQKNSLEESLFELKEKKSPPRKSAGIQVEIEEKVTQYEQVQIIDDSPVEILNKPKETLKLPKRSTFGAFRLDASDVTLDESLIPSENEEFLEIRKSLFEDAPRESKRPSKAESMPKRKTSSIKSKLSDKIREKELEKADLDQYNDELFINDFSEIQKPEEAIYSPKLAAEMFKNLIPDSIPSSQESNSLEKRENPYKNAEILDSESKETERTSLSFIEPKPEQVGFGYKAVKKVKTLSSYIFRSTAPALMKFFIAACIYALLFRMGIEFLLPNELDFTNFSL